jgi:hypothetical protein
VSASARVAAILAAGVAAVAAGCGSSSKPAATTTQSCGIVPFAAASSHGAFEIRATGASCGTAQAVAGAARSCFGCSYAAQGFHCTGHVVTTGLLRVDYRCTQGTESVTFVRG